jgi:hypothetical protein
MALVVILPVGALMVAVLRSEYGMQGLGTIGNPNTEQSVSSDVDFEALVYKYGYLYTFNDNGTVSIDLGTSTTRAQAIEPQDFEVLQQHAEMLDRINALVDDGTLYIDANGDYQLTVEYINQFGGNQKTSLRYISGGAHEGYVRRGFLGIPVGYHFALGTLASILFGAVTAVTALLGSSILSVNTPSKFVKWLIKAVDFVGIGAMETWLNDNSEVVFAVVYGVFVGGMVVSAALSAATGGIGGAVVGFIVKLLGSFIYYTLGDPFLKEGLQNLFRKENTVEIDTNLLFLNRSVWVSQR